MKRVLGILLVFCILLSTLTGCSAVSSTVNKAKIIGKWQVEDVQFEQSIFSMAFDMDMINVNYVEFGLFETEFKMDIDESLLSTHAFPAGFKTERIRYSVSGNTLELVIDDFFSELSMDVWEISFEGDNLILTNELGDKFILSRAE